MLALAPCVSDACSPYVEEHPDRPYATFRPHVNAFERCEVGEETYRRIVTEWLRSRPANARHLTSFSLGRAVAFPWVSRHIADAALRLPDWAARVASTPRGRRDALANAAIRDPELLARLALPFEDSRYAVTAITYEKVLYGKARQYSSHGDAGGTLVPFDAQLWLKLAPRGASTR
ncbi:MAG: hypothetical protein KDH15_11465 [Rhodocyclaceae bacterium]|nr:hypothetical protein [Rhodocyclaceae bacterium]